MKNEKIAKTDLKNYKNINIRLFCEEKIIKYQEIIERTLLIIQKFKTMDVIGVTELNTCITNLEILFNELNNINILNKEKKRKNYDDIINRLQKINNELSILFRSFGTDKIEDLISICFGQDFINTIITNKNSDKYNIIKKYIHPIGYKVMTWKKNNNPETNTSILAKNRIVEDYMIVETSNNFDCFDLARTSKSFYTKIYGIKVAIQNYSEKKTLIICGLVDDIVIECTNQKFIKNKITNLIKNKPKDPDFQTHDFNRFLSTITLKELLVYNNDELYQRFIGHLNQIDLIKKKTISQVVKEFLNNELYNQRTTLIQLLIKQNNPEYQYLAYLLYDLLSNEDKGNIDTVEQTILFDSLPWAIKKYFRDAMINTNKYTKNLSNFDNNKIPLEQQICLLKVNDSIKEKAMVKLKEVKSKSDDSGSKARQYLDGLLKIPFSIFKKEPSLCIVEKNHTSFLNLVKIFQKNDINFPIPIKKKYMNIEIENHINFIQNNYIHQIKHNNIEKLKKNLTRGRRDTLIANICFINSTTKKFKYRHNRLCHSGKKNSYMKNEIETFITDISNNTEILSYIKKKFPKDFNLKMEATLEKELTFIIKNKKLLQSYIKNIHESLDKAVHGHEKAKRQIERILGQWMNGEQTGYCFGFEGPPGIGKTSLAKKGLSNCLIDSNGKERPFSFIALGGSSNGSTFVGHNYTYVGSTWGKIVDILMESKCLNPIIFIDELDKVSNTEHGKEIIGILTHLIDSTQNDNFQDKYFNGIGLDLSKALFIFSYNDPSLIDRILLDRIHRIKFDNLTIKDKIIISRKYLIPEICEKMGLINIIKFTDEIIQFIIEKYTNEAGVRKLKEIFFEIISEINLEILEQTNNVINIPILINEKILTEKYLKERKKIKYKEIHENPKIGVINGMWANSMGNGGILPIQSKWYPCSNDFEFKLTGMQGDVMKESMNVAKTLAWNLTSSENKTKCIENFKKTNMKGIHIHCPEGATPKDGPSAGTAITISLVSLFNNKKIKNDISITGEITLQGDITAIGGLELKIEGAKRAGIKEIIFPKENEDDYKKYCEKYSTESIIFHQVSNINDVINLVFI